MVRNTSRRVKCFAASLRAEDADGTWSGAELPQKTGDRLQNSAEVWRLRKN